MFGFFDQKNNGLFGLFVYKIIDKYINFNIISFKISININNNSIYYSYYINYTL